MSDTYTIPALQYNNLGEPIAADQDAYANALMDGAQTFPNGVLDQSKPCDVFTPQIDEQDGDFAGMDPANLSPATMTRLATFGVTGIGKGAWAYASAENQHKNDAPPASVVPLPSTGAGVTPAAPTTAASVPAPIAQPVVTTPVPSAQTPAAPVPASVSATPAIHPASAPHLSVLRRLVGRIEHGFEVTKADILAEIHRL